MIGKKGKDSSPSRCRRSTSRSSASATSSRAASARAKASRATRSARATASEPARQGGEDAGRAHPRGRRQRSEELADILGEELALPRIEPKGKKKIVTAKDKYTGIRQAGPESLRHFKRTSSRR